MTGRAFLSILLAAISILLAPAQAAAADWLQAETQNFVIQADLPESELRDLALRMEQFDRLMRAQVRGPLRPGRKHHLYLDSGIGRISDVAGKRVNSITRTWPEMAASFAQYDPRQSAFGRDTSLFFAHAAYHQTNAYVRTVPHWLNEGLPLFFSTAYRSDGHFILGVPDTDWRMDSPMSETRIRTILTTLSAPRDYGEWSKLQDANAVFTNLLMTDKNSDAAIGAYLRSFNSGAPLEEAMEAFGDLRVLARDMRNRMTRKPELRQVPLDPHAPAEVFVRAMGEDEIALLVPRLKRLEDDRRESVARDLEKLAERFPDSAEAWYEHAAAEFALHKGRKKEDVPLFDGLGFPGEETVIVVTAWRYSDEKAWAAVNRALAINPGHPNARRLKAQILLSRMQNAGEMDDASQFARVRKLLAPMVARAEEFPYAAVFNYQTYIEQGIEAPQDAFDAFGRAFLGSAGVRDFRYAYAAELVRRGEETIARRLLESMLNDPAYREAAERALAQLAGPAT